MTRNHLAQWNATLPTALRERRAARRFRRRLFAHASFHRLLEYIDIDAAFWFAGRLWVIKGILSKLTPQHAKQWRQESVRAKAAAFDAAQILRDHAQTFTPKGERLALVNAAQGIEEMARRPQHFVSDDALGIALNLDFESFGQKGDLRAYAIREADRCVPPGIPRRFAMIRDFIVLIGIDASPALVRSTLLNGRT